VHLALTDEQQRLRDELRTYFEQLVTPELEEELATTEGGGPLGKAAVRKMAQDGYLAMGWPTEYGGRGLSPIEQFLFFDEAQRAGAPVPFLTVNTVGPAIQRHGTEAQKRELLPRITAGELFFAIGYTEPSAGTDLASLTTRAERDGDTLVINGQKIYTSLADHADYVWLACRTTPIERTPGGSKHEGISIVLVPTDDPGFSYTPIQTVGQARTFSTYYDDIRVPVGNVVGGLDNGWKVIIDQLNNERVSLCSSGQLERKYVDVRRWAQQTKLADGRRVVDQEWVQVHLARVHAKLDALRLINHKVAWAATAGRTSVQDSSATKVYGTELYCEAYGLLLEILGADGLLKRGSPAAALKGSLERAYRGTLILTFGGGVNEVQRDLIAVFGLRMPRSLR
jgi:3-oxocholest-4-en-26-oyl-CoA dehydrogenase alpha subunit